MTLIAPLPPWTDGYLHIMSKYEHDPWKIEAPDWTGDQQIFPWFVCDKENAPISLNTTQEEYVSMEMMYLYNFSDNAPFKDVLYELSYWTSFAFYNMYDAYV
jgi:hypothetical protein